MSKNENLSAEKKVEEINVALVDLQKKLVVKEITTDKALEKTTQDLILVKGYINKIKDIRDQFIKPIKENIRNLEKLFTDPQKKAEEFEALLKKEISAYRLMLDKKAKEEEDRLRKEQEKEIKKAEAKGKVAPVVPVATVERMPVTTKTESGKSSAKKVVKFEITDANAIPKKYRDLVYYKAVEKGLLDQVIRQLVKVDGMNLNMAGVRVYEDFDISVSVN